MIRLVNWFRRGSLERGLDRELQYHFDRRVADLTAAGISEPEARRRVAVELGLAQVREEVRDVWLTRWFRDFLYDLRFSARSFLRSPGFTATTLLSLALGGSRQPGLPLSSPPPPTAERLAARRVETVGDRSGGQVLLPYARRSPPACGREG